MACERTGVDGSSVPLRIYGGDGVAAGVCKHGPLHAWVVHLHHETPRDARALLDPLRSLVALLLLWYKTQQQNDYSSSSKHTQNIL